MGTLYGNKRTCLSILKSSVEHLSKICSVNMTWILFYGRFSIVERQTVRRCLLGDFQWLEGMKSNLEFNTHSCHKMNVSFQGPSFPHGKVRLSYVEELIAGSL